MHFNVGEITSYGAVMIDLEIQDSFNERVREYTDRFMSSWKDYVREVAQLYICLNHMIWKHHENNNQKRSNEYTKEWRRIGTIADETFNKEDLTLFYQLID